MNKHKKYDASSIEVLEGLEPVRRRPGMYIGGTDNASMHHLFSEVIDNAMDEAVANFASFIEVKVETDNTISIMIMAEEFQLILTLIFQINLHWRSS